MAETASKITGKVNPTELEKELVDRLRTFLIMKEIEVMDTGQILADMPYFNAGHRKVTNVH